MGIDSQKHDCPVRQAFAETILAILDSSAFFANNENDHNITINMNAAASLQIQTMGDIGEKFGACIRVIQDLFALFVNA
jgi:hypothetical protein